jgi:2-succinyl-6-hydroxy-2,4-cyclohexadiene-1-carboxylate synthase
MHANVCLVTLDEMAPTVVFLHGFTHTGRSWDQVIAALGEGHTALAPDLRGHGGSSAAEPVSLPEVLADVAALSADPFTLVGYSMGGRIALHVALTHGDRVQRLVLIGASPGLSDPRERAQRRHDDERLAQEMRRSSIEEFARRWAQTPVLAGLSPGLSAATHADRLRSTPEGLARALEGLGTGALAPLWDRLAELTMPVTLVVGERDQKFRALAAEMAESIASAEIQVVAGAGHAVHLEAPGRVAAIIASG